jgi:hypothetical protein
MKETNISALKTKITAFRRNWPVRIQTVSGNKKLKHAMNCSYLGCSVGCEGVDKSSESLNTL